MYAAVRFANDVAVLRVSRGVRAFVETTSSRFELLATEAEAWAWLEAQLEGDPENLRWVKGWAGVESYASLTGQAAEDLLRAYVAETGAEAQSAVEEWRWAWLTRLDRLEAELARWDVFGEEG